MLTSTKFCEVYPHLVDSKRVDLACDYLIHEFMKIFPTIDEEYARQRIRKCAPNGKSGDRAIRDFWNLFCAISSTWRIKNLYNIVTNPRIGWTKRETPIESLYPQTKLGWMAEIKPEFTFIRAVDYLKQNPSVLKQALIDNEKHWKKRSRGSRYDPIVAVKCDSRYQVRDGNSRLKSAIEQYVYNRPVAEIPRISAHLGEESKDVANYSIPSVTNCWIPTSSLDFLNEKVFTKGEGQISGKESLKNLYPLAFLEYRKRITLEISDEE